MRESHSTSDVFKNALALYSAGNLLFAEEICKSIVQKQPAYFDALYLLATIHSGLGRLNEALTCYDAALSVKPSDVRVLKSRAAALRALGRLKEALEDYDSALSIKPDYFDALNGRGITLRDLRQYDEALKSYEKALRIKPGDAEALNNRGIILRDMGQFSEALDSYDRALQAKPDYIEALNNRGIILRDLKRYEEALKCYETALVAKPDLIDILYNRANTLIELNRFDEGLAAYDRALSIKPDFIEALFNRGVALRKLGRFQEALASHDRALALNSKLEGSYSEKGAILQLMGRLDDAKIVYQKGIANAPTNARFFQRLSKLKTFSVNDPELDAMEALFVRIATLSNEDQIDLHFALGKALADIGQYDRSFHHLERGNSMKRRQTNYNETATLSIFLRIRDAFNEELIRQKHGLGINSSMPIFIIGMPRAGTTLVEQILSSHGMVFAGGELENFRSELRTIGQQGGALSNFPDKISSIDGEELRRLGIAYLKSIKAVAPFNAKCVTDKMPENFFFAGLIHLALPEARIIHVRRNPVDTCLSCYSQLFSGNQPHTYDLNELGRYYRSYENLMRHWRAVLPEGTILDVFYEELVTNFERESRRLIAHCGLDWDSACLNYHNNQRVVLTASAAQVRQPIYKKSVARWKLYGELLRPLIDEIGKDVETVNIEQVGN